MAIDVGLTPKICVAVITLPTMRGMGERSPEVETIIFAHQAAKWLVVQSGIVCVGFGLVGRDHTGGAGLGPNPPRVGA